MRLLLRRNKKFSLLLKEKFVQGHCRSIEADFRRCKFVSNAAVKSLNSGWFYKLNVFAVE